jgi:peptide chain release factor 1
VAAAGGDIEAARELAADDPDFAARPSARSRTARSSPSGCAGCSCPRDPTDDKDAILEVKSGEGGEESALFAGDLLRMYTRYADRRGWTTEVLERHRVRPRRLQVGHRRGEGEGDARAGHAPYALLKFEGGVHRVQRVPVTESQGRVHTRPPACS